MKRTAPLLLAALLGIASATHAADTAKTQPAAKAKQSAKPSARGPGTQTEDELYVGAKAKAEPKNDGMRHRPRARSGDEDLEDLEIQRNRTKAR